MNNSNHPTDSSLDRSKIIMPIEEIRRIEENSKVVLRGYSENYRAASTMLHCYQRGGQAEYLRAQAELTQLRSDLEAARKEIAVYRKALEEVRDSLPWYERSTIVNKETQKHTCCQSVAAEALRQFPQPGNEKQ